MQATVVFRDASGQEIPSAALSFSIKSMRGKDGFCLTYQSSCHWLMSATFWPAERRGEQDRQHTVSRAVLCSFSMKACTTAPDGAEAWHRS